MRVRPLTSSSLISTKEKEVKVLHASINFIFLGIDPTFLCSRIDRFLKVRSWLVAGHFTADKNSMPSPANTTSTSLFLERASTAFFCLSRARARRTTKKECATATGKNESEGVTRLLLENLGSMTRFFLSSIRSPGQPLPSLSRVHPRRAYLFHFVTGCPTDELPAAIHSSTPTFPISSRGSTIRNKEKKGAPGKEMEDV